MLTQVRRSGADWSQERNMIVHMLRANHSAGSQAGRQQAAGSYSMCPYICSVLAKMPSPSSSSSPAALPTGSLQNKNGSAKIYYKNSHSSGNQTAYYVKSAQHSDLSVSVCVCVCVGVHTYMFAVCAGKTWQQIVRSNGKVSSALNCTFI